MTTETQLDELRAEYERVFGEKPHHKAGAEKLRQDIDERLREDESGDEVQFTQEESVLAGAQDTKAPERKIEVIVLRYFWDEDEKRVSAGTVIEVPEEKAWEGVENGALRRVKRG